MNTLFVAAALIVALTLVLSLRWLLLAFQHAQIFKPAVLTTPIEPNPADRNLPYEDVFFGEHDGQALHGWLTNRAGASFTILICHGNAGNISGRLDTIEFFHRMGLNVFMFDYHGYGLSPGTPSESGMYRDAQSAWDYLRNERAIAANKIVVLGRSLGGGVATYLTTHNRARAVIIESTFTSIAQVSQERYPWLPHCLLSRVPGAIKFDNAARIAQIDVPLVLVHSHDDEVISFEYSKQLQRLRGSDQELIEINGSHSGGYAASGDAYRVPLERFLRSAGVELAT